MVDSGTPPPFPFYNWIITEWSGSGTKKFLFIILYNYNTDEADEVNHCSVMEA